jgi:hypothetical protein
MGLIKRKRCRHCGTLFIPDPRNVDRQHYCRKPECKKASKAESQRRWLSKPENQDYFRGPENVKRVQRWRRKNPDYAWGKPRRKPKALQDPLKRHPDENKDDNAKFAPNPLQDLITDQVPVIIGLIANFTGTALQDDIVSTLLRLQQLGRDIAYPSTCKKGGAHGVEGSHFTPTDAQSSLSVQLDRSALGP